MVYRNDPPKKYVKDDDGKLQLNPEYKSWKDGEESIVDDDGQNNTNTTTNNNHHTMDSINTATTPTTPTPASFGIREQLEQLNAIKDLLTPEEYATKRRDILASLNNNTATPVSAEEPIPLATVIVETVEDVDDDNNGVLDDASHGEIKYENGNTYIGSLNTKCKPHGKGQLTYTTGDVFNGEFVDGMLRKGQKTYLEGTVYKGEYQNDEEHGQGTSTYVNGDTYTGLWENGKLHGQGTFTWWNGDVYIGSWKNDKQHGQGTITLSSGVYIGLWENGAKTEGTFKLKNGDVYVGSFNKSNEQHGQGVYTFSNGNVYAGSLRHDKFDGYGKTTFAHDGWTERGEYKNDMMHGQGQEIQPDGTINYDGKWIEGKKVDEKVSKMKKFFSRSTTNSSSILIPMGTSVTLQGLISKPERNGDRGQIVQYDSNTGRYIIQIEHTNETMKVKPTNLFQHDVPVSSNQNGCTSNNNNNYYQPNNNSRYQQNQNQYRRQQLHQKQQRLNNNYQQMNTMQNQMNQMNMNK